MWFFFVEEVVDLRCVEKVLGLCGVGEVIGCVEEVSCCVRCAVSWSVTDVVSFQLGRSVHSSHLAFSILVQFYMLPMRSYTVCCGFSERFLLTLVHILEYFSDERFFLS